MDIFTHALLPYLIGSVLKLNKKWLTALVLGGIALDFDFLLLWINYIYPNDLLLVHRGITHSFLFGFLAALIVLYVASRPWVKANIQRSMKRIMNFDAVFTGTALAFAYLGVLSHLFLDYLTTRGVPLFYPFEFARLSADLFPSIEVMVFLTSTAIIAMLSLRWGQSRPAKVWLLAAFLIVIMIIGTIRIDGKEMSEKALVGANAKSYPDTSLFKWSILKDSGSRFDVYEYDLLSGNARHKATFQRLEVLPNANGSEGNISAALKAADSLPQVELFRWRAYATAINASFKSSIWHLEYYDPVVRAEQINSQPMLKIVTGSYASVKVDVDGDKAIVV